VKITIDIPEKELRDAERFTGARNRQEAVVAALIAFNRRQRLHRLTEQFGTMDELLTQEDLQSAREER
jgi:hypothetical protein